MSVRSSTLGATELRLAATIFKRDFTALASIGGASNQRCGAYLAAWVKLPNPFSGNQQFNIFGADTDEDGIVNEANQSGLIIGGPTSATSPLRPRWRYNTSNLAGDTFTQFPTDGPIRLIMVGWTNIGSNATPTWQYWMAVCAPGGTPETMTFANNATLTASTTHAILSNLFAAASTGGSRTPVGFELEHVAYVNGDFPWDTVNNPSNGGVTGIGRPHHLAIEALAGTTAPFHDFATLSAAQNAGSLTYPNLRGNGDTPSRPGRADVSFWWKLSNNTDLANYGVGGANTLSMANYNSLSGGVTSGSSLIAPSHWAPAVLPPTIVDPTVKFIGGKGTRARTFTGTYDALNTTALERRWVYGVGAVNLGAVAGAVVPGFDWADITGIAGGNWSRADTLPIGGPYLLQVRDKNNIANNTESGGWLVGTSLLGHGQSSWDQVTYGEADGAGNPLGLNRLGLTVDDGARGVLLRYSNAGSGPTWSSARPVINVGTMSAGTTPAVAQGAVAMLNEWNVHNPRHPLLIASIAIGGTNQGEWADNIAAYSGSVGSGNASWRFMGTIGAVPDAVSGNNSGVVELMAQALGRYVDCHAMMWVPGIADNATGASSRALYVTGIDERFSGSATAPWLVFVPWRIARDIGDASGSPTRRLRHHQFVEELGSRGIPGPCWLDPVMVGAIGHSAYTNGDNVVAGQPGDQNRVGQAKLGYGIGRALAWVWDRRIKANGGRLLRAYYGDASRNTIEIELGRQLRTLNGAAVSNQFWISTDNGLTFSQGGFTVALVRNNTAAILTTTGAPFPAANVRVEYGWNFPFSDNTNPPELTAETNLQGLLFDNQTHRGNTNLPAGGRAGTPLQGINRSGVGVAGLAVGSKAAPGLWTTERFSGSRIVTVRGRKKSTGEIVEKTFTITAAAA